MQPDFLEKRVVILERTVEGLSELPARMERVETQILHLRTEMHDEFSAIRGEMRKGDEETRTFMRLLNEETRSLLRVVAEGVDDARQQLGDLPAIKADVSTLKADVSTLKADVSTFKADVSTLKADVSTLKAEFSSFSTGVTESLSAIQKQLGRGSRRKSLP